MVLTNTLMACRDLATAHITNHIIKEITSMATFTSFLEGACLAHVVRKSARYLENGWESWQESGPSPTYVCTSRDCLPVPTSRTSSWPGVARRTSSVSYVRRLIYSSTERHQHWSVLQGFQ